MDEVAGGGGGSLDFLSTHPSSSNRVVKVREWAEEVCSFTSDTSCEVKVLIERDEEMKNRY